jgi:hypothetical protein
MKHLVESTRVYNIVNISLQGHLLWGENIFKYT